MTISYSETPYERIVAVGWAGRIALFNFTLTAFTDPDSGLVFAQASEGGSLPTPFPGTFGIGDEIPRSLWDVSNDTEGTRSVDISPLGDYKGQLAHFTIMNRLGKTGFIIADSLTIAVTAPVSFTVDMKIYTGGTFKVKGVSAGAIPGYPVFENIGGTLHYEATRAFTSIPHVQQVRYQFDENGFLGA